MKPVFLIFNIGGEEMILIVLVVLLLFGGRKIPELMRGLGRGVREFNDAKNNVRKEIEEGMTMKETETHPPSGSSTTTTSSTTQQH